MSSTLYLPIANDKISYPEFHEFASTIRNILKKEYGVNPEKALIKEDQESIEYRICGKLGTSFLIGLHIKNGELYYLLDFIIGRLPDKGKTPIYSWLLDTNLKLNHNAKLGVRTIADEQVIVYFSWAKVDAITPNGFRELLIDTAGYAEAFLKDLEDYNLKPFIT